MKKLRRFLLFVNHLLPVQLLTIQIRKYKLLLLFWLFLLGMISGTIGKGYGLTFLFLEPEYLGQEGFWSLFILGGTLGTFLFAYMITLYINESYRFHFIAFKNHPFLLFTFNNFLLPAFLITFYLYRFIDFQMEMQGGFNGMVLGKIGGLLMGMGLTFLTFGSYFFATGRRSMFNVLGDGLERELERARGEQNKRVILDKAKESVRIPYRVGHYLAWPFHIVKVNHGRTHFRQVVHVLNKHHGQLLLLQVAIFVVIAVLGLLEQNPIFQIPAGASIILMLALMVMMGGAITFWFRKSGILPLLLLGVFIYVYDSQDFMHEHHHAIGMNYEVPAAEYSQETLALHTRESILEADRTYHLAMLNQWAEGYREKYGPGYRPKAVFVSSSGGGLRSAFWTFRVLQELDSLTQGVFTDNIRLYSGASGGMMGAAYFRELELQRELGKSIDLQSPAYAQNLSKDLLNRISFRIFTDIFLPNTQVKIGNKRYDQERGYTFDQQLGLNLPELRGRTLGDYRAWEQQGLTPPFVMTPTITNQGKKLYIASSPLSFLARGRAISGEYTGKTAGVEFRRMFKKQDADSLWMVTALRMNATFPFVLPTVELPSNPAMLVMDAGAIDNHGIQTPVRYLFEFREWFAEHTDGVVFIQLRDNSRIDAILDPAQKGFFNRLSMPLGGGYKSMVESRDMAYDRMLEAAEEWFPNKIDVFSFEYPVETSHYPASISFHLTAKEKQNILHSLETLHNQAAFDALKTLYLQDMILAADFEGKNVDDLGSR